MKINPFAQYYLHEEGELLYRPAGGVDATSSFVRRVWKVSDISASPEAFLTFLLEAVSAGASPIRVRRLASENRLDSYLADAMLRLEDAIEKAKTASFR